MVICAWSQLEDSSVAWDVCKGMQRVPQKGRGPHLLPRFPPQESEPNLMVSMPSPLPSWMPQWLLMSVVSLSLKDWFFERLQEEALQFRKSPIGKQN